jgi:neutral ceramidase
MRVGHASAALTVPAGSTLGGYAARPGPATGTLDGLAAHAVTVHSGGRRLAWVVLDTPYVHGDLAAAVAGLLPGYDVWVSATHTHAGPETSCLPVSPHTPAAWLAEVPPVAAAAARAAVAAERDARLSLHRQRLSGVGGQRSGRRPRRTVPVDVLRFDGPAGLAGVVVVLPVHPTVLPADNRLVSADLSGAVRRALAERLGPAAFAVVATGAAGDISTRPHRRAQTPDECDRLGALVADAVVRGLRRPPRATAAADGPLAVTRERLALPPKPPTATPDLVRRLAGRLERARAAGDPVATRTAWTALQAAELALAEPARADPACAVSVARLGGVSLVGLGAEPYLDLAAQLDRLVAHPTVLVGYTNGYLGYLPVRAAYRRADYEVLRSPVAAGSAEHVIDRAAALATRMNQEAQ